MTLAAFLKERGISQRWLADQMGCHASHVSRLCNGLKPSPEQARQIAKILKTTPAALGWETEKVPKAEAKS